MPSASSPRRERARRRDARAVETRVQRANARALIKTEIEKPRAKETEDERRRRVNRDSTVRVDSWDHLQRKYVAVRGDVERG